MEIRHPARHAGILKSRPRYPLGKLDMGKDTYRQKGADLMHILIKGEDGAWKLRCRPTISADYNYTGYTAVVNCTHCKRGLEM